MRLSGRQMGESTKILVVSLRKELTILVRIKLEIVLDETVSPDDVWKSVAFDLIDGLNREERVIELVRAIREERPNDTSLIAFCDALIAQANGAARPASADSLRRIVDAFNHRFQQRNELFKYLIAYKAPRRPPRNSGLPSAARAGGGRGRADPSRPLAEDVALFLEDHVKDACENAKEIEFPDNPPPWIARLVTAAGVLNGPDVDKMPRQVERLRALPADGLGPLNDKLFENASRLEPRQLIGSLDSILAALGPGEIRRRRTSAANSRTSAPLPGARRLDQDPQSVPDG